MHTFTSHSCSVRPLGGFGGKEATMCAYVCVYVSAVTHAHSARARFVCVMTPKLSRPSTMGSLCTNAHPQYCRSIGFVVFPKLMSHNKRTHPSVYPPACLRWHCRRHCRCLRMLIATEPKRVIRSGAFDDKFEHTFVWLFIAGRRRVDCLCKCK